MGENGKPSLLNGGRGQIVAAAMVLICSALAWAFLMISTIRIDVAETQRSIVEMEAWKLAEKRYDAQVQANYRMFHTLIAQIQQQVYEMAMRVPRAVEPHRSIPAPLYEDAR
jgi:hypothetical protein